MATAPAAPAKQRAQSDRTPSGIPGLDELISGGFEREGTALVMGDAGCGKTTFLAQFLYNGALQYNEPSVLLSFEEPGASIIKHMGRYGFDFAALEKQGVFTSINYRPHEVKKLVDEGGGLIWDTISSIGAKRLAIDSLTSYAMLFESLYQAREAELLLFELLRKWKCTTLLSAEGINTEKMRITTGMEYLSDGVILLHHPRYQSGRYRAIEILKMRGCKHSEKLCPYEFVEGEGIRVHPGETVFYDVKENE
jgi:circadian clock protein KaiC